MRLLVASFLVVMLSCFAGCASKWQGAEFASDLHPASIGRTAIVIHRPTYDVEPLVSDVRIRASVAKVLHDLAGATEAPLSTPTIGKSDYELIMAAREAKADTVCVMTMRYIGQELRIILPLPVEHRSFANFNFRLLDAKTGKLLLEMEQSEGTLFPGINKDNALHDLERGMRRTLQARGFIPQAVSPENQTAAAN